MGDAVDDQEKLFLLEVLVDSLFTSNSSLSLDKNATPNTGDTCVLFQFLHYPPLVVCESDFIGTPAARPDSSSVTFKSGKSCFFSLRLPRALVKPVPLDVNVSVSRKLKTGEAVDVGKTRVCMGDLFTELLRHNSEENCDGQPSSRTKKGVFELKDGYGRTAGSLVAFLRISCFGKLIITQFSLNKEDEKSFLFKGADANKLCTAGDGGKPCAEKRATSYSESDKYLGRESFTTEKPRKVSTPGGYPAATKPGSDQMNRQNFSDDGRSYQYQARERPCVCPPSAYSPPRYPPPALYGPPSRGYGAGGLCECPYPMPPGTTAEYGRRTPAGKTLDLAPGEVGLQDDRVVFQLPLKKPGDPETGGDSSVYYKLTSAEETPGGRAKNTVHVNSNELGAGRGAVGPVSGLPADDRHDVFLLKIGKKCEGDQKRNLELELRTPKMKEPKPPTAEQGSQYCEADCPEEAGRRPSKSKGKGEKSKDKGKKGKGKGKK